MYRYYSSPSGAAGISQVTGTVAWTYTGYGTVFSGTPGTIEITGVSYMINLAGSAALYDTTHQAEIELSKGTGGTVLANIPFSWIIDTGVNHKQENRQFIFPEPITLEPNTIVTTRVAQSLAQAITYSGIKIFYRYLLPTNIQYDNITTAVTASTNPFNSPLTFTHFVSEVDSRLLLVGVSSETGAGNSFVASTVTYNSVSLTKIGTVAGGDSDSLSMWYLFNPPVGSNTISIDYSPTSGNYSDGESVRAVALSLYNVHSGTPIGTYSTSNQIASTTTIPAQGTITTTMGGAWIVDYGLQKYGGTTMKPYSGQTSRMGTIISSESRNFLSTQPTTVKGYSKTGWYLGTANSKWAYMNVSVNPKNELSPVVNRVQSAQKNGGGYVKNVSLTMPLAVTAGNVLVGAFAFDPANPPTYFQDNLGNTYNTIEDGGGCKLYYSQISTGGSCTITGSVPTFQDVAIIFNEYSGLKTNPLDVSSENTEGGYATTHVVGTTGTTSQGSALAVAVYRGSGTVTSLIQINGFDEILAQDGEDLYTGLTLADKALFTTGQQSGTFVTDPDFHQGQGAIAIFMMGSVTGTSSYYRANNFLLMGVA